ncbi:MAG TPA: M23 family metallopeptidase [Opitutaceae bacterium]
MAWQGLPRTIACGLVFVAMVFAARAQMFWPTPNKAFAEGRPYGDYIQPTVSGLIESGMFGCVRNSRLQFHEGLDLKPIERDGRGETADPVFAVLPGVVRHTSTKSGLSSYGRYVVVEHGGQRPEFITLYAHLLSISPGARAGAAVEAGQTLGIMGRSAAGYSIPRERAHLHVEAGVWLSEKFQQWYHGRKFGSKNDHGVFNGMNIVGFDYLDFVERLRARQVRDASEYLARLPTALTVLVRSAFTPDFVRRYPELVDGGPPEAGVAGWEIDFTWFGLPKAWRRLDAKTVAEAPAGKTAVLFHDAALLERFPCQDAVRTRRGRVSMGGRARDAIEILFTGE